MDLLRSRIGAENTVGIDKTDSTDGPEGSDGRADAVAQVFDRLRDSRERAHDYYLRLRSASPVPPLDPLMPAIRHTIAAWAERLGDVEIVHHRHNLLTDDRIALLQKEFGQPAPARQGRLAGFRLADGGDVRVQLADILAGTVRAIVSDELAGRGDPVLTALVRPYVDDRSLLASGPMHRVCDARTLP